MAYDVFISYRRKTGVDDARFLQQALKARGYNVFFDYDSLRDGKFDETIFEAIDEAPVFVLMLTEWALDRCINENDWVRLEIERAIKMGKKIVSVAPSDQKWRFPEHLPDTLCAVRTEQVSELNKASLFEESIEKMIKDRFPAPLNTSHVSTTGERLFAKPLPLAETLCRHPLENRDGGAWATLLGAQPQFAYRCPWEKLDGEAWAALLRAQPQFADRCPWEKLNGEAWAALLGAQPQFADRCPWEKLDERAWATLLRAQPQFADRCPWERLNEEDD